MPDSRPTAILPVAYMPDIPYFVRLMQGNVAVEQHENYVKQTCRNRCTILTANGIMPLIIPVQHTAAKIKIRDVRIDYATAWQTVHWRALTAAYRSSPFFEYYIDDLQPFYRQQTPFLFDFNCRLTAKLAELVGFKLQLNLSESYLADYEYDYRKRTTQDGGFKIVPYYQVFSNKFDFQPRLSIIDLLCNEGNNAFDVLKQSF
jgi:hypothetical protein